MKIKVCGMKFPENITAVAELAPDYIGFICYEKSPRYISTASPAIIGLDAQIVKTGVFVNAELDFIKEQISMFGFTAVQLHGAEKPEFCNKLKSKVTVLKAFGVDESFDFEQLSAYVGSVDYFLFDTKTNVHGGSGKTFDWQVLSNYKLTVPFFLSGGLSLENLENIKHIKHPAFYGVDLNSRFETEPGLKDVNKLREAFKILRDSHEI
jgi:phosphoribosylanthranilate isomerase